MSFVSLWQRGYVIEDVDKEAFDMLKAECIRMLDSDFKGCTPHNEYLAGSIKHEYVINDIKLLESIKPSLIKAANQYVYNYNYNADDYDIESIWANFQSKGEFNPIHDHSGDLSFVIYIQVPYKHSDENTLTTSSVGFFGSVLFYYPNHYNRGGVGFTDLPVDQSFEGKIILFSSDLLHSVYPFLKSDGVRISVAGNLIIKH